MFNKVVYGTEFLNYLLSHEIHYLYGFATIIHSNIFRIYETMYLYVYICIY